MSAWAFVDTATWKLVFSYQFSSWLNLIFGDLTWGVWVDSVTAIMFVTVSAVSLAVHIYSIYYMGADPYFQRFLIYLTLFTFCMLFLVGADNYVQLFFGWEGVGLCSYLLINFWYTRPQANKSAIKAMVVNRVGDCAFILALPLILLNFGSFNFQTIFSTLGSLTWFDYFYSDLDVICLLLFIAAMAKSAQLGLHTWLPDAMEGPTPVSALIHAATMVTAGVYLVIRSGPLFNVSVSISTVVLIIGALTAVFAATAALGQHDIKKIIAYSTCSQLGYMFMACGLGNFSLALFHLVNHAFFKALLFMGAGILIHSIGGEQDLRKMGGLANFFPFGLATVGVASLSLAGLPFLSGYYSKDAIIGALQLTSSFSGIFAWILALLAAVCTSVYSFSVIYYAFFGAPRGSFRQYLNLHHVDLCASGPLFGLVIFSMFSGFYLRPYYGSVVVPVNYDLLTFFYTQFPVSWFFEWIETYKKLLAFAAGLTGIVFYTVAYRRDVLFLTHMRFKNWILYYEFLANKWYWDSIYNKLVAAPVFRFGYDVVYVLIDKWVIEYVFIEMLSSSSIALSKVIARAQSGFAVNYIFWTVTSFVIILEILFILDFLFS